MKPTSFYKGDTFGDFFRRNNRYRPLVFPRCVYCTNKAVCGCVDCQAPMCEKCGQREVDRWKCRLHTKRLTGAHVAGELVAWPLIVPGEVFEVVRDEEGRLYSRPCEPPSPQSCEEPQVRVVQLDDAAQAL